MKAATCIPAVYRYASERGGHEGLRIGVAHYLPRGVRKEDWQAQGYFDLWVPLLAPAPNWIKKFRGGEITFPVFARHYRAGMKKRESAQVIDLLAGISLFLPISLGCFCEDETKCHRSVLQQLVAEAARKKKPGFSGLDRLLTETARYSSPVCFANWEEESAS